MLDVGFNLDYCGHQVIENVQEMICASADEMVFRSNEKHEVYVLPTNAVEFIIPHIEKHHTIEEFNDVNTPWAD